MMDSKDLKMNLLLAFFLMGIVLVSCQTQVTPVDLKKISDDTNAYFMDEMNQAFEGVRSMKKLKEKAGTKHQAIIERLEETRRNKEEALKVAQEAKQQLNETQNVCNETMLALWEECKPCLKQTCIRFYSKTCSSGAGLVGRQFQQYLDHASPISLFLNEDKIDDLEDKEEEQKEKLEELEEDFETMQDAVDRIFHNSMKVFGQMQPLLSFPFTGRLWENLRNPIAFPSFDLPFSSRGHLGDRSSVFQHSAHRSFQDLFKEHQRMLERTRRLVEHETEMQEEQNSSSENTTSNDRMVCKELRRNSEGCLKMKDKCDKCKEILAVDCSGKESMQSSHEQQYIEALRLAEKYTSEHKKLLEKFQEEMLNMTGVLDQLNEQYGWVSKLANFTDNGEGIFKVSSIRLKSGDENGTPSTTVTAKLFDSEPFTVTVPGKISLEDPDQYELVAQEALKQFKKKEQGSIDA
ncbi:clusterin isoform X2 [Lissotriton helveticus]